jgi:hypothetical protein
MKPVLEHLQRLQAGQERIVCKLEEVNRRAANLAAGQASMIQHIGHLASATAQHYLSTDRVDQRLARIERRLELT